MVIGGIASIPERVESLHLAAESVLPYVDSLHVALNGYADVPAFLHDPKITVHPTTNERGDANKFLGFDRKHTFLSFDDDLTYSPAYFARLSAALEDRPGIISMHGRRIVQPFRTYYKSTQSFRCLGYVEQWERVDFAGTGVMAIPANTIDLPPEHFEVANMADVWVGIAAKEQGVPIWVAPHRGDEIRHNDIDLRRTIFAVSSGWRPKNIDHIVKTRFIEATQPLPASK